MAGSDNSMDLHSICTSQVEQWADPATQANYSLAFDQPLWLPSWQMIEETLEATSWCYASLKVTIGEVLRSRLARRSVAQLSGGVSRKSA